jgi:hypothetical protein
MRANVTVLPLCQPARPPSPVRSPDPVERLSCSLWPWIWPIESETLERKPMERWGVWSSEAAASEAWAATFTFYWVLTQFPGHRTGGRVLIRTSANTSLWGQSDRTRIGVRTAGFGVLTPFSSVKSGRFGGTHHLHHHGRRVSPWIMQQSQAICPCPCPCVSPN